MESFPEEEAYQPIIETGLPLTRKVGHVLTPIQLSNGSLTQETVIRHTSNIKAANELTLKVIRENRGNNRLEVIISQPTSILGPKISRKVDVESLINISNGLLGETLHAVFPKEMLLFSLKFNLC